MATPGKKGLVKVPGAPVAMANEATTSLSLVLYQVTNAARRLLTPFGDYVVEQSTNAGANWNAVTAYTLNRLTGSITFSTARSAGTLVRISGNYLPMATAAECKSYRFRISAKNDDTSAFGDEWVRRTQALLDATGALGRWASVDRYFRGQLVAEELVLIEIYANSAAAPDLRVWARMSSDEMTAAVEGQQENSVEWEGSPDAEGRVVSVAN
jgi:hypothetical protein